MIHHWSEVIKLGISFKETPWVMHQVKKFLLEKDQDSSLTYKKLLDQLKVIRQCFETQTSLFDKLCEHARHGLVRDYFIQLVQISDQWISQRKNNIQACLNKKGSQQLFNNQAKLAEVCMKITGLKNLQYMNSLKTLFHADPQLQKYILIADSCSCLSEIGRKWIDKSIKMIETQYLLMKINPIFISLNFIKTN